MRHHRLAVVLTLAGVLSTAAAAVDAQTPTNPYFEFVQARRLEAEGDVLGALAALTRAAAADPRSSAIRAEIAGLEFRRNRRDEAEKAARESLALDAKNPDAHRILGFIYTGRVDAAPARTAQADEMTANVREAISHLEAASTSAASATDINVFLTLGRLYLRNGDGEKAVQALSRVVALNPNFVQGRLALSQAFMSTGNLNGAIDSLGAIVEDEPRVAATLGQYLERANRPKEAADAYSKALEVTPNSRDLKFRRAAALFAARDFAEASEAAAGGQLDHPDDSRFPRLRARALFETGASARAIDVLEPVARANPTDNSVQFALADLYNDAGRFPDAEKVVRQVVAREPTNADALNYLGYLLADKGQQLDEAIVLVRRALDIEPDNPSYLDSLGWAYYRRGDANEAQKYLAPAADKLPRNSVVQDHMGDVFARLGRWQDAINAWTRALEGDGDSIDRAAIEKKVQDARSRLR
jgi:tetratricopeptide (TPR) repeat protein